MYCLLLEFAFSAIIASSDAAASAGQWVRDGPASVAVPFLRRTGSALTARASTAPASVPVILVEDLILVCALRKGGVRSTKACRRHNGVFCQGGCGCGCGVKGLRCIFMILFLDGRTVQLY